MKSSKWCALGIVGGFVAFAGAVATTAQAGCNASTPGNNTTFLIPIGTGIRLLCTELGAGATGNGRAVATGVAGTSVSADLQLGDTAVSGAFNASRVAITACTAFDSTAGDGPFTDSTGCAGAAFHDLVVTDN